MTNERPADNVSPKELSALGTGVDLQKLTGQKNYLSWKRDFKLVAQAKGLWEIIAGTEKILMKPDRTDYFLPVTRTSARQKKKSDDEDTPTASDQTARIAEYRLDLDEYRENEQKVRLAMSLIIHWVDASIRGKLQKAQTPTEVWSTLEQQYKMQAARSLHIAQDEMESIHLSKCKGMQDYINRHELKRMDIEDSGGVYSDEQLTAKLLRGLSNEYTSFLDQYYFLQDVDGVDAIGLSGITSRLLTHESKLDRRKTVNSAARDSETKEPNTNNQQKNQKKDNKKPREKCPVEGCGKWGHTEDKCWVKHPELKKARDDKKEEAKGDKPKTEDDKKKFVATAEAEPPKKKFAAMAQIKQEDYLAAIDQANRRDQIELAVALEDLNHWHSPLCKTFLDASSSDSFLDFGDDLRRMFADDSDIHASPHDQDKTQTMDQSIPTPIFLQDNPYEMAIFLNTVDADLSVFKHVTANLTFEEKEILAIFRRTIEGTVLNDQERLTVIFTTIPDHKNWPKSTVECVLKAQEYVRDKLKHRIMLLGERREDGTPTVWEPTDDASFGGPDLQGLHRAIYGIEDAPNPFIDHLSKMTFEPENISEYHSDQAPQKKGSVEDMEVEGKDGALHLGKEVFESSVRCAKRPEPPFTYQETQPRDDKIDWEAFFISTSGDHTA
ncbi:hypothetical protein SLS63_006191 [Diaporthe eres]|uniref:Uncharacterized protein n=1 Tax=Diaporthe eres TaxID=83184 RepID=A0ABR1P8P0_DIAER